MRLPKFLLAIVLIAFGPSLPAAAAERLPVVASFSILGDLVANIGGERVAVEAIVGPDGDAHVYQPTPEDARRIAHARLVFVNGLGFDGWMQRLAAAAGAKARIIDTSAGLKTISAGADDHGDHHDGAADPHVWQSVANVKHMIATIRDALIVADPAGRAVYEANEAAYSAKLDALDREIRRVVTAIPPSRRRIITNHDAFGYFAAAYGVALIAPEGTSTEAEASAQDVARVIRQIRDEKIPAVFLENVSDPRLMQQIAAETSARIGGTLYSDALSAPSGPAGTYIAMMEHNIRELERALMATP